MIPKLDPQIIILAHQAYDDPGFPVSFFDRDGSALSIGDIAIDTLDALPFTERHRVGSSTRGCGSPCAGCLFPRSPSQSRRS